MKLLFYLPKCHLSIYIISHLLYHLPSLEIFVILPTHPFLSIHEYWSHLIKKFQLEYIYQLSKINLQHLHLIPFDQILKKKEIRNYVKENVDSIFYILPSETHLTKKDLQKEWKILFSFQKRIDSLVCIDSIHLPYVSSFIQKIKSKKNHYVYYHGLYLGENERGISQDGFLINHYFENLSKSIQQKKWNSHFEILYLDDLHSLYEYVYQQLKEPLPDPSFQEFLFLNTHNPNPIPISYEVSEEYSLPTYLEKWIQQYHTNVYQLHERNDLHKIGYSQNISFDHFLQNHSKKEISSDLMSTLTQGIVLLSFLILLFICGIFLYFKIENKHYLFIFMIMLSLKLPLLFQRFYQDILNTIPHLSHFYSGKLIYEENEIQEMDQDEILYLPITPTLWKYEKQSYLQPEFPILNFILQNSKEIEVIQSVEKRLEKEKKNQKYIVPIFTKSILFKKVPSHFQWIDFIQQELRFFSQSKENKTIFGKLIPIEDTEELQFEIERLFQKYK